MKSFPRIHRFSPLAGRRLLAGFGLLACLSVTSSSLLAQDAATDGNRRRGDRGGQNGDRQNMSPQDMQARMLSSLRERFEVTDDEEWKVLSDRLSKVLELRRNSGGGGFGGFMGRGPQGDNGGGDRGDRGGRGGGTRTFGNNTELSALSSAVRDKLPDAEIKARLERVRETRRDNEVKLAKAQEELRAVLTVRQEAVAVMYGMLP